MAALAILLILLPLSLLALVGVILLVLGIVQRRNALWITGIVLMVLSFVPAILMAAGVYWWVRPIQSVQMPATAPQPVAAARATSPRRLSGDIINELAMPAGTRHIAGGVAVLADRTEHWMAELAAPPGFDAYLAGQWRAATAPPPPDVVDSAEDMWDQIDFKALPRWRTTYPLQDGTLVDVYLWYDAKAGKAYCISVDRLGP